MTQIYLVAILIVLALAAGAGYLLFKRWRQNRWLDEAISSGLLASWTYTQSEWRQAVADEFSWGSADALSAEIYFYPSLIYIKSDGQKRMLPLERDDRVVTFAGYSAFEGNPLKLRVRWKVVTTDRNGNQETKYYKDDYRIPVPLRVKDEALRVVDFFETKLQSDLASYTALVPDDDPISLFGKDSF